MAQVPVLVLPDGRVMTESAAILIHLADSFPGAALAPAPGDAGRPDYLRWMIFIAANLYKTDLRIYYPARYCDDAQAAGAVKAAAGRQLVREWEIYADALGEKPFMLGERLSAVDIYAALQATWHPDVPALFAKHPNIKAMCQRVTARPSVAKVWARHGL
jgi:glutathione S-transferase